MSRRTECVTVGCNPEARKTDPTRGRDRGRFPSKSFGYVWERRPILPQVVSAFRNRNGGDRTARDVDTHSVSTSVTLRIVL